MCARVCVRVRVCVGQASVNPKVETVEELLARRKNLHLGMMKLAMEDLALVLQAAYAAYLVPPKPPQPHHPRPCPCPSLLSPSMPLPRDSDETAELAWTP